MLAYPRRHRGKDSIWLADIENRSTTQVTDDQYRLHDEIEFAPDGRTIYFTAKDESHPTWTLMKVPSLGGPAVVLSDNITGGIAVSADGSRLAYFKRANGRSAVFIGNTDGTGEQLLFQPEPPVRFANNKLSWTPTGSALTLALTGHNGADCNFVNLNEKGELTQVGNNLCSRVRNFAWLPDGSGIVTTHSSETVANRSDLSRIDIRSGARTRWSSDADSYTSRSLSVGANDRVAVLDIRNLSDIVTTSTDLTTSQTLLKGTVREEGIQGLAEAPDGKILYTVAIGRSRGIWQMNPDGSEPRELIALSSGSEDQQVSVTLDNRFIIFESNRSGSSEIWRANRDGSNLTMLTSGGKNSEPTVTNDFVFFTRQTENKENVWRIPAAGGDAEQITTEGCSWPDVSPDSRFLACASGVEETASRRTINIYDLETRAKVNSFDAVVTAALYNRIRWTPDGTSILYKDTAEGLWKQPLDGSAPERLPGYDNIRVFHLTNRADRGLLYSGGTQMRQIVILEPPAG